MDKIEEVQKVVEHANNGDWIPLGILYSICSLVLILLGGIHRKMWKDQKEHNDDQKTYRVNNDILLNKVIENQHQMQLVTVELKTIVEYHKEELKTLKK